MEKKKLEIGKQQERQLKGLVDRGIVALCCADCGEKLLCLQLTSISKEPQPQSQVLTRVVAKCGFCSGYSYVEQVAGQFYPGAPNDQIGFDVENDTTGAPEADFLFKTWIKK